MAKKIKQTKSSETQVALNSQLSEFRDAIRDEIREIEKNGQSTILLKEGKKVSKDGHNWYKFAVDYMPNIPADTPCKLSIGNETHEATVISFDETSIIIDVKDELPRTIADAKLENGATVLMELLIKRIEDNSVKVNNAGQRMLEAAKVIPTIIDNENVLNFEENTTENQKKAICHAVQYNVSYIWGPPGTGKTKVISQIINELLNRNRTVLLVSHTNSAVNGAIKKVDEKFQSEHGYLKYETYPILRLGAGAKYLEKRLQLEEQVAIAGQDLTKQKEELEIEQKHNCQNIYEYNTILNKIHWIDCTHIAEIEKMFDVIQKYNENIEIQNKDLEHIKVELNHEILAHPEYKELLTLRHEIEQLNIVIKDLSAKENMIMAENVDLDIKISNAKDQIATHKQYSSLKEAESHYFTEKTLNEKIISYNNSIGICNENIKKYNDIIDKCKQTIERYENKSYIGKLFANKSEYNLAVSCLSKHSNLIKTETNKRDIYTKSLQDFKKQHVDLLSIKQRLATLKPEKTIVFWQSISESNTTEKAKNEGILDKTRSKLSHTKDELNETQQKINTIPNDYIIIDDLIGTKNLKEIEIKNLIVKRNEYLVNYNKMIDVESDLVHNFYQIGDCSTQEDIQKLKTKYREVRNQVDKINSYEIKDTIKNLTQRQEIITSEIKRICEELSKIQLKIIHNAKVIGTTLAKSYLSDEIQSRTFDTIIIDEASMAAIPALWCATQVAEKNVVIVGDFLQLPPIVLSDSDMSKKWLGRDIFSASGVQKLFKKGATNPGCCFMLDNQFRMEKEIAELVNMYYNGYTKLKTDDNSEQRKNQRNEFNSWYNNDFERNLYSQKYKNKCIHMISTESLNAWVTSVPSGKAGNSRFNAFSAVLTVELAFKLIENKLNTNKQQTTETDNPLVLIVAPYKAHIKRIEQLLDDKYHSLGLTDIGLIKAGTIHSFQGKEADIVIFDLVVDEPHHIANLFMSKKEINLELEKMFNVAISRAKFKLFFVGNFTFCMKRGKNKATGDLLSKLLINKNIPTIDAKIYFPNMTYAVPSHIGLSNLKYDMEICLENEFIKKLENDVKSATKRIVVYSPFMTEKALSHLLPMLKDAVNRNIKIIVITKTLEEISLQSAITQKKKCESNLASNGISVIHKKGMHEKLIFIDDNKFWIGSLNLLSFSGATGEVMCKIVSSKGVKEFADLIDLDNIIEVSENKNEQKCPCCGKEVIMAESNDSGFYWRCIDKDNCNWSRNNDEQYPINGKYVCQKCGADYKLEMKKEPRWICKNNPRHYRKVRKNDLKLNEMWKGITPDDVDEVRKYFENVTAKSNTSAKNDSMAKTRKKSNVSKSKSTMVKSSVQLELF